MKLILQGKLICAGLSFMMINFSCNLINSNKGSKFYYYPQKNIYYDIANANYFYSLDSGKSWDSVFSPMEEGPGILGKKEIVYTDSGEVWKENALHRKLYNGVVLNIINEESSSYLGNDSVISQSIDSNARPVKHETKKQKKRPVKNFFQRLFRGKKKQ